MVGAVALRQQPLAEQHDDGHGAEQQRHADERELEEAEASQPASTPAFETSTFTGVPVSASIEPACAEKDQRHQQLRGVRFRRTAMTTTTGSKRRHRAVDADQRGRAARPGSMVSNEQARRGFPRRPAMSSWPAQAVTPVTSKPALTTNSDAMKITAGSPRPASAWLSVSTPVAQSASATPIATMTTGNRSTRKGRRRRR